MRASGFRLTRLAAIGCALAAVHAVAAEVTLVRDGQPAAVIVLPAESASREIDMINRQAASELVHHIRLMSGAELRVLVTLTNGGFQPIRIEKAKPVDTALKPVKDVGGLLPIRLGEAADPSLNDWLAARNDAPDAYVLAVDENGVQIRGRIPVGVQHATFALLEQMGVRWHDPLMRGLVVPARKTVTVQHQRLAATPTPELTFLAPVTPRGTIYTVRMKHEHVARALQTPYVTTTLSGDTDGVIGFSSGWPVRAAAGASAVDPLELRLGGRALVVPAFPPQRLYGYRITDRAAGGNKAVVVLTDGNHSEFTGSWSFHGFVEFLLGDDPQAAELRRLADFYVYPLVNPDGRYTLRRTDNPELAAAGWPNHLAVWLSPGLFATGDALAAAIRFDTGGRADYLIDFHSNGTCIYTPPGLAESALVKAMTERVPSMKPGGWQRQSTTEWAMHPDGLRAPFAFQPEHNPWLSVDECQTIGRAYALAVHDALTGRIDGVKTNTVGGIPTLPMPVGTGASSLLKGVMGGKLEAVAQALEAGDDVNGGNVLGLAPLQAAAQRDDPAIARLLLARGANVRQANGRGWTPLHYAVRYGNTEIARLLLDRGADVNARHVDGDTPLHLAAAYNRGDIVRLLLDTGADAAVRGAWDRTALDWAQQLGYNAVSEQLMGKGGGK